MKELMMRKCFYLMEYAITLMGILCLVVTCTWIPVAEAATRETKRGYNYADNVLEGYAGGTETRAWAYLHSKTVFHYAYAVEDGDYYTSGSIAPGGHANVITGFGTWDMSQDDAQIGPLLNGTCYPSWESTPKKWCAGYPKLN